MKISKEKVNEILDIVWDWSDYEVEGNRFNGFDVTPSLDEGMKKDLGKVIANILSPKQKWWKFW